jgi:hypothetical protein
VEEFSVRKGRKGMGVFQDCLEENRAFLGNDIHKIDGMFYRTMERVMVMVVRRWGATGVAQQRG